MITLDQIRKLDDKVQAAVRRIRELITENGALEKRLGQYERRIEELEVLIKTFKEDQAEIEKGIVNALSQLDHLEDDLSEKIVPAATGTVDEQNESPAKIDDTVREQDPETSPDLGSDPEYEDEPEESDPGAELDIF